MSRAASATLDERVKLLKQVGELYDAAFTRMAPDDPEAAPVDERVLGGMIMGMTMAKIAVTVPRPLLAKAQQAVREGRADSVSAYVASAIEERAKVDDLAALLDEMLSENGGPITPLERREAERALGVPRRRKRRSAA